MIPDNYINLIEKLIYKTNRKEAIWTKTSRENEFKLELDKGAITIDQWNDENLSSYIDISILNDQGDRIDRIAIPYKQSEEYNYLLELHTLAKRAHYKVDETFKNIMDEINRNKIIGKEGSYNDDLPF